MDYLSFCGEMSAVLLNHLDTGTTISREMIQKNNGVLLDALIIHVPDSVSAPIIYLKPLYWHCCRGNSVESICRMVLSSLEADSIPASDMLESLTDFKTARSRIVYRLISQQENKELLKTIPWVPFLDLAVIFYIYLGSPNENLITSIIHNKQAEIWGLSPDNLFSIAKENTPALFPSALMRLEQLLIDYADETDEEISDFMPNTYILTNRSGIHGASCLLYDGIIKDFAAQIGTDLIILPSSIHEVLLIPDLNELDYSELCRTVCAINQTEVPKEDILSDRIYLFRRFENPHLIVWNADFHTADTDGTMNP